jgi:hypothetical protein
MSSADKNSEDVSIHHGPTSKNLCGRESVAIDIGARLRTWLGQGVSTSLALAPARELLWTIRFSEYQHLRHSKIRKS